MKPRKIRLMEIDEHELEVKNKIKKTSYHTKVGALDKDTKAIRLKVN